MTKRYREDLEEVETQDGVDGVRPTAFRWRGNRYRVTAVLGHWREDPGWWRRPSGEPIRIEQRDLWRVEAAAARQVSVGVSGASRIAEDVEAQNGAPVPGVYELVRRGEDAWRLDRVWD
jgi:hypothetical protein